MKKILGLLMILSSCANATFSFGRCPQVTLQSNFEISKYMGDWYELVRNKDMRYEHGDCGMAHYSLESDGHVKVVNSELVDGEVDDITGEAYCDDDKPAQCHVRFSKLSPYGDYKVLSTDYDTHSLVFSCFSIGIAHWKWVWLLSRTPDLDYSSFIPNIENLGIPESALYFPKQSDCPR